MTNDQSTVIPQDLHLAPSVPGQCLVHPIVGDVANLIWGGSGGGLLSFDWSNFTYVPAMSKDMPNVSADGRTYTFSLRDDLQWSNGSPVTVDDFTFAYDNASKKDNDFVGLDQLEEIERYTTPDAHTIQVTLKHAKPLDLGYGMTSTIGPVPKHIWENKPWNDPTENPEIPRPSVVLGPFPYNTTKLLRAPLLPRWIPSFWASPRCPSTRFCRPRSPQSLMSLCSTGEPTGRPAFRPTSMSRRKPAQPDRVRVAGGERTLS